MNGEPQDSTTSSGLNVEGLRSISDQNIGSFITGSTYTGPRVGTRGEDNEDDLTRARVASNGPGPNYNPRPAPNQVYQPYHAPSTSIIPPRIDSLNVTHEQARDEMRRRATLMMLQRQREQQNIEERRRRATDTSTPQVPYMMPRRHANSLSMSATYGRPAVEVPGLENSSPIHPAVASSQASENQQNGYAPPRWQPDTEVTNCPICNHAFSFFFRKHHCRKCGRVVCANCSPHRITIPRQYIVNPPAVHPIQIDLMNDASSQDNPAARLAADQMYTGLGGGQEVRLCNPCVPDPHPFSPPPYSSNPLAFAQSTTPRRLPSDTYSTGRRRSHLAGSVPIDYARYQAIQSNPATMYRNLPPYQPNPTVVTINSPYGSAPNSASMYVPRHGHPRSHRHHASLSVLPSSRSRAVFEAMTSPEEPPAIEEPSRQIPEEDECPICHEELPPKRPDGSEVDREAHVAHCIEGHFSSSRPRDSSMPNPSTAIAAAVVASAATPGQAGSSIPSSGIAGPSVRRRTTGMVVYNATEKDCVGEDGTTQECIICFEDFEPGAEMGRLECLCKFHKTCIRSWWDTKGAGACPVHQGGLI